MANVTIACEYSAPLLAPRRKGRFAGKILGAREARKEREGEVTRPRARNPLPLPFQTPATQARAHNFKLI